VAPVATSPAKCVESSPTVVKKVLEASATGKKIALVKEF
jgi:hypothetical protein